MTELKTFYVLWTYIGNYSDNVMRIPARSAEEAVSALTDFYSPEFAEKARIYVFDTPPALVCIKGEIKR